MAMFLYENEKGNEIMSDSAILDSWEKSVITNDGDNREIQTVLTYDLDCNCYEVEYFESGMSKIVASFDTSEQAGKYMSNLINEMTLFYDQEKLSFERYQVTTAVDALRKLAGELGNNISPEAAQAMTLLADIISKGKASSVRDDLQYSFNFIYQS
jgi:hypothetical protein